MGAMRPLLAVTAWRRDLPTFWDPHTSLFTLADHYVQAFRRAGAVPLLLAQPDPEDCEAILDRVDGLVLTGGGDVDPAGYGADRDPHTVDVEPEADAAERALIVAAREHGMPTLGICRGMQILNVALGGTMRQHITTESGPHGPEPTDPDLVKRHGHEVRLEPGSRLASLYGTSQRWVNSYHHQAVDRVADGLTVAAVSPDGIVEGLEHDETWDALGVQWHPEKTLDGSDDVLFDSFVELVRAASTAGVRG